MLVDPELFDPRRAALNYAGRDETDAVNAIVCALVYVGDQLRALRDAESVVLNGERD